MASSKVRAKVDDDDDYMPSDEEDSIPKPKPKLAKKDASQEEQIKKKKKKKKKLSLPPYLSENNTHMILASAAPKASERVVGKDDPHFKQLNGDEKVDETDHDDDMLEEELSKHKHKEPTLNPDKDGKGNEENNNSSSKEENEDEQVDETDDDTQKANNGEGEDVEYDPSSHEDKDVVDKAQNVIKKTKLSLAGGRGSKVNQVWSSDDKVAILKGMIDFEKNNGSLPDSKTMGLFHESIRSSITAGTNTEQLWNKIRKLKGAYLKKSPIGNTPQDRQTFELSKIIWGANDTDIVRAKDVGIAPTKDANKRKLKEGKVGMVKRSKCEKEKGTCGLNKEPMSRDNYASKKIDKPKRFWKKFPHFHAFLELDLSRLSEVERNREMKLMMNIDLAKIREIEEKLITYQINEINYEIKSLNQDIENLKWDKERLYLDKESDDVVKEIKSLRSSIMEDADIP